MRLTSLQFYHVPLAMFPYSCSFPQLPWCWQSWPARADSQISVPPPSSHYLRSLLLLCISVDWDLSKDPCSDPLPVLIVHLFLEPWLLVQGPWRSHQWRPKQERPWVTQPFFRALSLNHLPQQVHVSIYILTLQSSSDCLWTLFAISMPAELSFSQHHSCVPRQCCCTPTFVVCLCFHSCIQILCIHKVLGNVVLIFYKHEFLESKLQHEEDSCLCS